MECGDATKQQTQKRDREVPRTAKVRGIFPLVLAEFVPRFWKRPAIDASLDLQVQNYESIRQKRTSNAVPDFDSLERQRREERFRGY
jgi:hypothetical protein